MLLHFFLITIIYTHLIQMMINFFLDCLGFFLRTRKFTDLMRSVFYIGKWISHGSFILIFPLFVYFFHFDKSMIEICFVLFDKHVHVVISHCQLVYLRISSLTLHSNFHSLLWQNGFENCKKILSNSFMWHIRIRILFYFMLTSSITKHTINTPGRKNLQKRDWSSKETKCPTLITWKMGLFFCSYFLGANIVALIEPMVVLFVHICLQ